MSLNKIFPFLDFLNEFRSMERKQYAVGINRRENDAEHSYQLAMLCWYVKEMLGLGLDIDKVIKFALVHDLVEVYAGDTPFWDAAQNGDNNKVEREQDALQRIRDQFGNDFPSLGAIIFEYEEGKKRKDLEACFVHAMDKLIPILNNYQDNGRSWKDLNPELKLEKAIELKRQKIKDSNAVEEIFDELVILLKEKKYDLFLNPD